MTISEVDLIPWDPDSSHHVQELHNQRIQCGWNADLVETWRAAQVEGFKCVYWIVVPSSVSDADDLAKQHVAAYPETAGPLYDTGTSVRGKRVAPSNRQFQPVGHIGLDTDNPSARYLNLEVPKEDCFWITTFYVSTALQSQGLGRAAMDKVESMAVLEPLCARTLMLDTLLAEDQKNEAIAFGFFGGVPKISNQEWYARRGYRLIKTVTNHYTHADRYGNHHTLRTVFMRRDIAEDRNLR